MATSRSSSLEDGQLEGGWGEKVTAYMRIIMSRTAAVILMC